MAIEAAIADCYQLGLVASLVTTENEAGLIARALQMALALNHAIYDCVYLAMAEHYDEKLVRADSRFLVKVAASEWRALQEALV